MNKLLLTIGAFLLLQSAYSQEGTKGDQEKASLVKNKKVYDFKQLRTSLVGTYQLKVFNSDVAPLLSKEDLELIASSRKQSESVVIILNDNVSVFIPSFDEINSSDFKSLEQTVYIKTNK